MNTLDIYQFHDYRQYLRALFDWARTSESGMEFSLRILQAKGEQADASSKSETKCARGPSYWSQVLTGEFHLDPDLVHFLADVFELDQDAELYLQHLLKAARSNDSREKVDAWYEARKIQKKYDGGTIDLDPEDIPKGRSLYTAVALCLPALQSSGKPTQDWINAHFVHGRLFDAKQIHAALDYLVDKGALTMQNDRYVYTSHATHMLVEAAFHEQLQQDIWQAAAQEIGELALKTLKKITAGQRQFGHVVTTIPSARYNEFLTEVRRLRGELVDYIKTIQTTDGEGDTIVFANFQAGPITNPGPAPRTSQEDET